MGSIIKSDSTGSRGVNFQKVIMLFSDSFMYSTTEGGTSNNGLYDRLVSH